MAEKRNVLIVLVGDPMHTASQHDALRPLLKAFKDALKRLAGTAYRPDWWYAAAPLGPGADNGHLRGAIRAEIEKRGVPHVIVPIASAATKAAKAVVDTDHSTNRIPIVFTVVSEPEREGILDGKPRITGVSRSLVKSARDAVERFADLLGRPCHIYCCFRPGLPQAEWAWQEITAKPPANATLHREKEIRGNECKDFVQAVNQVPPRVDSQRTGIFMIPDDLVGRCAPHVVRAAHRRNIPTFFQQLEWVCPGQYSAGGPFAPGGYGVTAEWVGKETAASVHPVIERPDPDAATRAPRYPRDDELQFWANESVAKHLELDLPPGASPCQPGPSSARSAGQGAAAARAAARPRAAKRPAREKPVAKRRAARRGREAQPERRAARGKRTARRAVRRRKR